MGGEEDRGGSNDLSVWVLYTNPGRLQIDAFRVMKEKKEFNRLRMDQGGRP